MAYPEPLAAARELARRGVEQLRVELMRQFGNRQDIIVGVNGSYARQEVTPGSDVDIFFLSTANVEPAQEAQLAFLPKLATLGFRPPSEGGVFENPWPISTLRDNIGGLEDTNDTITRRMLFLLEGEWLCNESDFDRARTEIIHAYVPEATREGRICRFLLNDIVRYWRTICVDYEQKIRFRGKARAIRLIKLRFSRMLLYFAGVLAVAETYQLPADAKRAELDRLLRLPAINRVRQVTGADSEKGTALYCEFLSELADPAVRDQLEKVSPEGEATQAFVRLYEKSREFRQELIRLLYLKYGSEHAIISALLI
jgi:hypothetical protein